MISLLLRAENNGIKKLSAVTYLSNTINEAISSLVKTSEGLSLYATFSNLSGGCCENRKITLVLKTGSWEEKFYWDPEFITLKRLEGSKK